MSILPRVEAFLISQLEGYIGKQAKRLYLYGGVYGKATFWQNNTVRINIHLYATPLT